MKIAHVVRLNQKFDALWWEREKYRIEHDKLLNLVKGLKAKIVSLLKERDVYREAVWAASYALDPNQGEVPDPIRAQMLLLATFPDWHPNGIMARKWLSEH